MRASPPAELLSNINMKRIWIDSVYSSVNIVSSFCCAQLVTDGNFADG